MRYRHKRYKALWHSYLARISNKILEIHLKESFRLLKLKKRNSRVGIVAAGVVGRKNPCYSLVKFREGQKADQDSSVNRRATNDSHYERQPLNP